VDWAPGIVILTLTWMGILAMPLAIIYRLYDFVADVGFLVVDCDRRNSLEAKLRDIVVAITETFKPDRTIIAAHSLGSVLVTQALVNGSHAWPPSRLHLLTLGSPIKVMANVFGGVICGPRELLISEIFKARVQRWSNCWRDCDLIGRRLNKAAQEPLYEHSLGGGPHANYWTDARLWQTLESFMVDPEDTLARTERQPETSALEGEELRAARRMRVSALPASLGMIVILYLLDKAFLGHASRELHGFVNYVARFLWFTAVLANGIAFWVAISMIRLRLRSREDLGSYRLVRMFLSMSVGVFGICLTLVVLIAFLVILIR
jgi:hypothetical protein